jgi:hypothetical protein
MTYSFTQRTAMPLWRSLYSSPTFAPPASKASEYAPLSVGIEVQ